jgi:hypothetical protein
LHDQNPLGFAVANQVAALRQTDLARELELDEGGSGYRRLGRNEMVRISATRLTVGR